MHPFRGAPCALSLVFVVVLLMSKLHKGVGGGRSTRRTCFASSMTCGPSNGSIARKSCARIPPSISSRRRCKSRGKAAEGALLSSSAAAAEGEPQVTSGNLSTHRRGLLRGAVAAGGALLGYANPALAELGPECEWPLNLALPVWGGFAKSRRKTIRQELVPGKVWAFDQAIGIYYVAVPIRMTVVAMDTGGLFVYAPVTPTQECLDLLRPLIAEHGPVRYIVLPSVAVEHKVCAGPFARRFPSAEFYATDKQYAFPLNLPSSFLGLPSWTQPLPASSRAMGDAPWAGEFEHEVLRVKPGVGSDYQDAAFFHKSTKT